VLHLAVDHYGDGLVHLAAHHATGQVRVFLVCSLMFNLPSLHDRLQARDVAPDGLQLGAVGQLAGGMLHAQIELLAQQALQLLLPAFADMLRMSFAFITSHSP